MKTNLNSWRLLVLTLFVTAAAVVPASAGNTSGAVRAALDTSQSVRVIMQFATTEARDAAFNRLLDRGAAVRVVDTEGGPALVVYASAVAVRGELSNATQTSLDSDVTITGLSTPARARSSHQSTSTRTPVFNGNGNRHGIAVAVIDSGLEPHPDLPLSRIRYYKDFVSGTRYPIDACGHGTHVAGIVAGSGARSNGRYAGIAPNVDVVALRVLDGDCSGKTSDVIDALEWVARNHDRYNIKVVNLSLGHPVIESIFNDPLVQAVERLSRKGIFVAVAAGNRGINKKEGPYFGLPGFGGIVSPANAPSAYAVGSLDTEGTARFRDDSVALSSSAGPTRHDLLAKPDGVAPGVEIVSLAAPNSRLFREYEELRVEGSDGRYRYFSLSGTSMAAPAVAGAAALLLQQNDDLTANTIKMVLQFTSRRIAGENILKQGAGALNIRGALKLASVINPSAPYGSNWITSAISAENRDGNGRRIIWGQRIIYGDRFIQPQYAQVHLRRWSDDFVWAWDNIVWGNDDNIVWGNDNIVWGNEDNIVWGNDDNIVWGNSADENIVWGNGESDNIVWGIDDNIVWGNDDNIVWGNTHEDNIVWGNNHLREVWASNTVAGFWDDNIVWGNYTRSTEDNIVWGNGNPANGVRVECSDNIVWGNDNIVWGNDDNIVWGNLDNIVWGNENIVWGNCGDNIVWGNENIVWGNDNIVWGNLAVLTGGRR